MKLFEAFTAIIISTINFSSFGTCLLADIRSGEHISSDIPSVSSAIRFRRATPDENLKDYVEKMQAIARLSNVIYLQQGLSNGTILQTGKLIQELLHFGSITTGIIGSLDLPKIETALISLKELSNKPPADKEIEELENGFATIGEILKKMEGRKQYSKWEGKDDYEADLKINENGNQFFEVVSTLNKELKKWTNLYSAIMDDKSKKPYKTKHFGYMESLSRTVQNLTITSTIFKEGVPLPLKFKDESAREAISLLIRNHESFQLLQSETLTTYGTDFDKLETNIKMISSSVTEMKGISSSLENIKTLYFSRLNPATTTSAEYTSGLPNGYDDVVKLSQAFSDNEWLKRLIKNDSLSKSYPSVQSLGISLNSIQKHLGPTDQTQFEVLAEILEYAKRLGDLSNFPLDHAKTIAKSVSKVPVNPLAKTESVENLISKAKMIDKEQEQLRKELEAISKVLSAQVENFGIIVNKIGEADENDNESVDTMMNDLFELKKLEEVNGVLAKINLSSLTEGPLKQLATDSVSLLKDVDAYQTSAQTLSSYLNSLLAAKDAPKVVDAFKNFKLLRLNSKDKKKYDNGLKYVQGVVNTKNDLGSLKKAIEAAKGTTTLESGSLNLFQKSDAHSKILGLSTRAIVNMKSLLDKKSDFDVIKTNSKLIKDEMNKNSKKFNQTETESLNSLTTLDTSLDKMFIELNTWKDDVSKLQFTSFKSYSKVFTEAKKVNPLSVDLGKMSLAMEKLIDLVQDQKSKQLLQQVKTAVDTLNGLQFSKYSKNFDRTEASLDTMNMFFANYLSDILVKLTPKAPFNKKKIVQGPSTSNGSSGTKPKVAETNSMVGYISGGTVALVSIIVAIIFGIWIYRRCKKRRYERIEPFKNFKGVIPSDRKKLAYSRGLEYQYRKYVRDHANDVVVNPNGTPQEQAISQNIFLRFAEFLYLSLPRENVTDLVRNHLNETNVPLHLRENDRIKLPTDQSKPVHFPTDYIHANKVKLLNCWRSVVMQGAVQATVNKIWYLIQEMCSSAIVSLCNTTENGVVQCQQFYGSARGDVHNFGEYTVKCTERTDKGDVITRKQELSIKGEHIMDIDHYQHTDWPAGESGPRDPQSVIEILNKVRNLDKHVIVHCNDGAGRSGTFVFIEQIQQEIYFSEYGKVDHGNLLRKLREMRSECVQSGTQLAFAMLTNLEMAVGHRTIDSKHPRLDETNLMKMEKRPIDKFLTEDHQFLELVRAAWKLVRPPPNPQQQ